MNLTNREREFCDVFIAQKGDDKKICDSMNISWNTSRTHRNNIYLKLLVNSKCELMHYLLTEYSPTGG
jgi:DNA-binding CsgD family transcriptional regulator